MKLNCAIFSVDIRVLRFDSLHWVRFIWFFSGCPPGCGTEDKAAGHFICTGLHRRVTPLCPGLARSLVTGQTGVTRRCNPVQIK